MNGTCFICNNFCGVVRDGNYEYIQCNYWSEIDIRASYKLTAIICPRDDKKRKEKIFN